VTTEIKRKLKSTMELRNYTITYSGLDQREKVAVGIAMGTDEKW
jgi:hypothetical protein